MSIGCDAFYFYETMNEREGGRKGGGEKENMQMSKENMFIPLNRPFFKKS